MRAEYGGGRPSGTSGSTTDGPPVSGNADLGQEIDSGSPASDNVSTGGEIWYVDYQGNAVPEYTGAENVIDLFDAFLGRPPTPAEADYFRGKSTVAIVTYLEYEAARNGASSGGGGGGGGVGMSREMMGAVARAIWADMGCIGPLPDAELNSWIAKGWLLSSEGVLLIKERIKALDAYWNGSVAKTDRIVWREDYEGMTGREMTTELAAERDRMYREGYSRTQWQDYVKNLPEYETGPERMAMKQVYLDALYQAWGVGAVDDLIAANPDYMEQVIVAALGEGQSFNVVYDWARQQPEWLNGPEAASSRENLRNTYANIMRTEVDEDWLNERALDGWTPQQMAEYLRGTEWYEKMYGAKPAYMSEDEYWDFRQGFNMVGAWYYGQAGSMQFLSPEQVAAMQSEQGITNADIMPYGVYRDEEGRYVTWGGGWSMSDAQLGAMIDAGWTPAEWEEYLRYQEQGWAELDNMNYLGEAIGRSYTHEDAVKMVSWAEGSGKLRAEMQKAENRRAFDTPFAILTGRKPTLADYAYLETNFVSPEHYYQTGIAEFQAEAMFPDVDDLFRRVYGYAADMQKLVDVNLNRPGSGGYKALLDAAEELDRYRLPFKLYYRRDPTPEDYAGFVDMAGPDELIKNITVQETILAEGPSIRKIYNGYWVPRGEVSLTDDDLETLVGKYQGWGAIQARLTLAEERRKAREQSVAMSLRWGAAISPISYTEFGGPKLPGLRRIGG